jgi:hypothetical protein
MLRLILSSGLISGLVIITGTVGVLTLRGPDVTAAGPAMGYGIMVLAMGMIPWSLRKLRSASPDGALSFGRGMALGLGITLVASLIYVALWEVYLAATHYEFMGNYIAAALAAKKAEGLTGVAYDQLAAQMEAMRVQSANPLLRLPMTFAEIAPVGLVMSLFSAALFRRKQTA